MSKTVLSRLSAWVAMLCVAAMVNAGLVAVQANALNLQHAVTGEVQLPDGGWTMTCGDGLADCDSHLDSAAEHEDGTPFGHHHHHSGESPAAQPAAAPTGVNVLRLTSLDLRPGQSAQLIGIVRATPDQPPRV